MHSENLEFNAYQIEIESNRTETEILGKFMPNEFRIFNFFLIFFQIFMIRFGRIELELRASFSLMLYSVK